MRPALEDLRDLAAQGCIDVVLCYSPDRLARKFAYQALLIEEFARAGVRVEFVKGPRGDTPEDQLLVQFQGMFAEYEKAQLMERYRRGKAYRARTGSVNVLSGAPFGYRYVRKSDHAGAAYEILGHEAVLVAELFRRYADDGASIADLARWLTSQGAPTRTGKSRWDRSVVWAMLRNPAYAGTAVFGKTMAVAGSPALNRVARLQGRTTPRAVKTVDRPKQEWTQIPVPVIVTAETFERAGQRLEDNKRFAARNTKVPSLLQGLAACSACGYGYYRTSARTTSRKIYYYRCLGSDDYRYEGGRVCANKPVRADYLDQVVWDHITGLLASPALIRAEIGRRLQQARTADPAARQRAHLELALAKASTAITAMIEAFQEQLITIDELRSRMPGLRARETGLRAQIGALDAQLADRESYLKLADDLEGFLAQLRGNAGTATIEERQRVLRLLVKDVLVGPQKITIRHRIPIREQTATGRQPSEQADTEGDHTPGYPLRWGRGQPVDLQHRAPRDGGSRRNRLPMGSLPGNRGDGPGQSGAGEVRRRRGRPVRQPGAGRTGQGPAPTVAGGPGAGIQRGKDPGGPPRRGLRLPGLQRPPLRAEAADQTQRRSRQAHPQEAGRRGARPARGQRRGGHPHAQPDRAGVVRLLSGRGVHGNVPQTGPVPVAAALQVGALPPQPQVEAPDREQVLRPVPPAPEGPVGIRRPGNRRLAAPVRVDENHPARPGQGPGVPRRPRLGRVLGQPPQEEPAPAHRRDPAAPAQAAAGTLPPVREPPPARRPPAAQPRGMGAMGIGDPESDHQARDHRDRQPSG